jgi:hypothetical protein
LARYPREEGIATTPGDEEDPLQPVAVPIVAGDLQVGRYDHSLLETPVVTAGRHFHVDVLQSQPVEEDEYLIYLRGDPCRQTCRKMRKK